MSFVLNNFIKNRLTEKSSDLRLVLFKGQASRPYSRIGRHLDLINSKITSFTNMQLVSIFYMMLRFVDSLINTHNDDDDDDDDDA